VKFHEPLYGFPSRQLVPEHDDASSDAHEGKISTRHCANPKVQLKQGGMQPQPLWLLEPLFPPTLLVVHVIEFWRPAGRRKVLTYAVNSCCLGGRQENHRPRSELPARAPNPIISRAVPPCQTSK
jgi:hypothetical protein